ncbi:50S ribosomal protein L9 [bacterium]|nr:50S ribosomal protein L9 [bacterium]
MANVEVYLKQDMEKMGKAGDRVLVKSGFARNYLIPRNLAMIVTKGGVKVLDDVARQIAKKKRTELKDAESVAAALGELKLLITRQAGEEGKIFGSVSARDIAAVVEEKGMQVDYRKIQLERPIKSLGIHTVPVRIHPEITAELKVWVEEEKGEETTK